ncbi:MAG: hypothetical protein R6W78_10415 [Bacteroidales bacterium]
MSDNSWNIDEKSVRFSKLIHAIEEETGKKDETHYWNSLNFYLNEIIDGYQADNVLKSKIEVRVCQRICKDYPAIDSIELRFIMIYVKTNYHQLFLDFEKQKSLANDILSAKKLMNDPKIRGVKIAGSRTRFYTFLDPELLQIIKSEIIKRAESLEAQLVNEFITDKGKVRPKNYFLKHMTKDIHKTLMKRYNLKTDQAACAILEIYSCYEIKLNTIIGTREQIAEKAIHTNYPNYKAYLLSFRDSFLK